MKKTISFLAACWLILAVLYAQSYSPQQIEDIQRAKREKVKERVLARLAHQGGNEHHTLSAEQDCIGAIPITQTGYTQTNSYVGEENDPNEITPSFSCLGTGEQNDVWYTFTAWGTGYVGFTITPMVGTDDYDWAVFDITTGGCSSIATDPNAEVSCNFSGNLGCGGVTGATGQTTGSCGGQNEPYFLTSVGHTYVINVSNFTGSASGYTIQFVGNVTGNLAYMTGAFYNDANTNCVKDANEYLMGYSMLNVNGPNGNLYVPMFNYGTYSIWADTGIYSLNPIVPSFLALSCANDYPLVDTLQLGDSLVNDIGVIVTSPFNDLAVNFISPIPIVPGFSRTYTVVAENNGTSPQAATVSVAFDASKFSYMTATPAPTFIGVDSIAWNTLSINPFQNQNFSLTLNTLQNVAVGIPVSFTSRINPLVVDSIPSNNVYVFIDTTVGSYDPNDKQVIPNKVEVSDVPIQELIYKIRFQNTGNYPATMVVLKDTLSDKFDIMSFEPLSGSHPFSVFMSETGVLEVLFDNIQLVPQTPTNGDASIGYFAFKIKAKPGLIIGDEINNRAGIYFDYNDPILTNTATVQIIKDVTTEIADDALPTEIHLYPNPAQSTIQLSFQSANNQDIKLSMYNLYGQKVYTTTLHSKEGTNSAEIPRNGLASGMYLLELENAHSKHIEKVLWK